MCNHHLRTTSYPRDQRSWRSAKLSFLLISFLILAGLLLSPASTGAASAGGSHDATQDASMMAACYGVYHIVRPGQTLYSIAAAYGTTAYRIAMCNSLSSYTVYAGQSLLIPTYRRR